MKTGLIHALGRKILSPVVGKTRFQKFFEHLYELSLAGLNSGGGNDCSASGEVYVMNFIKERLTSAELPWVIFDVGANVGQYLQRLTETFRERASIWSFEPSRKSFQALSENAGSSNNVTLKNFGFGDREMIAPLFSPGDASKIASLHYRRMEHQGVHLHVGETVRIRTIDNFCREENIPRIHLLKIDVEGHELKVLKGARKMMAREAIDFIQFEFGAPAVDARIYFKDFYYLLQSRYKIYRILQDGMRPIKQYQETCEIFRKATNYLAERIALRNPA